MRINLTPYEKWQAIWDKTVLAITILVLAGIGIWCSYKLGMEILLGLIIVIVFLAFVVWNVNKDIKKKELLTQREWDKKKQEERMKNEGTKERRND